MDDFDFKQAVTTLNPVIKEVVSARVETECVYGNVQFDNVTKGITQTMSDDLQSAEVKRRKCVRIMEDYMTSFGTMGMNHQEWFLERLMVINPPKIDNREIRKAEREKYDFYVVEVNSDDEVDEMSLTATYKNKYLFESSLSEVYDYPLAKGYADLETYKVNLQSLIREMIKEEFPYDEFARHVVRILLTDGPMAGKLPLLERLLQFKQLASCMTVFDGVRKRLLEDVQRRKLLGGRMLSGEALKDSEEGFGDEDSKEVSEKAVQGEEDTKGIAEDAVQDKDQDKGAA
nr:uncharacterized protein LOC107409188 [Ziziphus jujuba var. spinosa]